MTTVADEVFRELYQAVIEGIKHEEPTKEKKRKPRQKSHIQIALSVERTSLPLRRCFTPQTVPSPVLMPHTPRG